MILGLIGSVLAIVVIVWYVVNESNKSAIDSLTAAAKKAELTVTKVADINHDGKLTVADVKAVVVEAKAKVATIKKAEKKVVDKVKKTVGRKKKS